MVEKVETFAHISSKLEELCKLVGTSDDTPESRSTLQAKRKEGASLAKELTKEFKSTNKNSHEQLKYEKARTQFHNLFERFQITCQNSLERERLFPLPPEVERRMSVGLPESFGSRFKASTGNIFLANSPKKKLPSEERAPTEENLSPEDRHSQAGGVTLVEESSEQVDVQILRERNEAAKQIEREVVSLHKMFQDINVMIEEQGEKIDGEKKKFS